MANHLRLNSDANEPLIYQIRLQGHLDQQWADWFGGLTITLEANGETVLTGPVADQAALHGLLRKVRDLGLPLLSVTQIQSNQADTSPPNRKSFFQVPFNQTNQYYSKGVQT
jgi:hypothetical protein